MIKHAYREHNRAIYALARIVLIDVFSGESQCIKDVMWEDKLGSLGIDMFSFFHQIVYQIK